MAKSRSRKKKKGAGVDWRAVWGVTARVLSVALLVAVGLGLTIGVKSIRAGASIWSLAMKFTPLSQYP